MASRAMCYMDGDYNVWCVARSGKGWSAYKYHINRRHKLTHIDAAPYYADRSGAQAWLYQQAYTNGLHLKPHEVPLIHMVRG